MSQSWSSKVKKNKIFGNRQWYSVTNPFSIRSEDQTRRTDLRVYSYWTRIRKEETLFIRSDDLMKSSITSTLIIMMSWSDNRKAICQISDRSRSHHWIFPENHLRGQVSKYFDEAYCPQIWIRVYEFHHDRLSWIIWRFWSKALLNFTVTFAVPDHCERQFVTWKDYEKMFSMDVSRNSSWTSKTISSTKLILVISPTILPELCPSTTLSYLEDQETVLKTRREMIVNVSSRISLVLSKCSWTLRFVKLGG